MATDTIYLLGGGSVGAAERINSPLEARLCEVGLVALASSPISDADYDSMAPLGLEPMFSRPLPLSDAVLIGLQTSHARGVPVVVDHSPAQGGDGAGEDPDSGLAQDG